MLQHFSEKRIEKYKKEVKEWEDKVKKNEEHLKKLESEKKRDQHEGELGVILWGCVNVNTYSCLTLTRIVFLRSCMQCVHSFWQGMKMLVVT